MADPTAVLFVCLGNICRSPMADAVLRHKVAALGRTSGFIVESAGTAAYHIGNPPDPRTQATLRKHGVPVVGRARQVAAEDWATFDHILAMDRANLRTLQQQQPVAAEAELALVLAPTSGSDVPDPYYGGDAGFDHVYALLDEALDRWLDDWA